MTKAAKQHSIGRVASKVHRPKPRRGSARKRGYGTAWNKFRYSFLATHPLCEFCMGAGKTVEAVVVDHDTPHRGDPELFWRNEFTALCISCHSGTKARLEAQHSGDALDKAIARAKRGQTGHSIGADGWTV